MALMWVAAPAQVVSLTSVSPVDLAADVAHAKQIAGSMVSGSLVVEGEKRLDNGYLVVEKLEFKSGARLIFTNAAIGRGDSLLIVTKEIVAPPDGTTPAIISWEAAQTSSPSLSATGQGASGKTGGEDSDGGPGLNGGAGVEGVPGRGAPSLTVLANRVMGSNLRVSFDGQGGAAGGKGQKGGDGGNGGPGHSASQTMVGCSHGPGNGGNGGQGGNGGLGGRGGTGGAGGVVRFGSVAEFQQAVAKIQVSGQGGNGGVGGVGGDGGNGGLGGPVGAEQLPYCNGSGRHNGSSGGIGTIGNSGSPGDRGVVGQFVFAPLTQANFDWIFKLPD
jgi:hypothetical protein